MRALAVVLGVLALAPSAGALALLDAAGPLTTVLVEGDAPREASLATTEGGGARVRWTPPEGPAQDLALPTRVTLAPGLHRFEAEPGARGGPVLLDAFPEGGVLLGASGDRTLTGPGLAAFLLATSAVCSIKPKHREPERPDRRASRRAEGP